MSAPIFIGDEISAAAYRLAGALVRTPAPDEVISVFRWAQTEAPLVLITVEFARWLPSPELNQAIAALAPPVLVVPDVLNHHPLPDLAIELRSHLGVEA